MRTLVINEATHSCCGAVRGQCQCGKSTPTENARRSAADPLISTPIVETLARARRQEIRNADKSRGTDEQYGSSPAMSSPESMGLGFGSGSQPAAAGRTSPVDAGGVDGDYRNRAQDLSTKELMQKLGIDKLDKEAAADFFSLLAAGDETPDLTVYAAELRKRLPKMTQGYQSGNLVPSPTSNCFAGNGNGKTFYGPSAMDYGPAGEGMLLPSNVIDESVENRRRELRARGLDC